MGKIVVLGGTGFVGRAFCELWMRRHGAAGGRLTVPSRQPQRARALYTLPTVEVVRANVHDAATLATLVTGADAVVNLVAILHGSPAQFQKVHVDLPRQLAAACKAAGVGHLVHVSALAVAPQAPSNYLRSKAAGEAVLRSAGVPLTVLRPSVLFGAEDRFINLFAQLQRLAPVMPLVGADAKFQPAWVNDVALALATVLERSAPPADAPATYECAGPTVYTLAELVRRAGQWSGHARPIIPLPRSVGLLQAALMECLPGEPPMSRDNVHSLQVPSVATPGAPGFAELGITPQSLDSVMPEVLHPSHGPQRLDAWRRQARRN